MPLWNHYFLAHSIQEALQALQSAPGPARLIAGGTDLLLDLAQGRSAPVDTLVDITAIPELNRVELCAEELFIGAALPLEKIVASRLVREYALALAEACELIGGPQVRNAATLGGNVAHALPAADGTIALLALDAEAEITSLKGFRRVGLQDFFTGPGRSVLDPGGELLTGFYLPVGAPGTLSAFRRVMRPQGVALPILNMALWAKAEAQDGFTIFQDVRLAVGPAAPTPFRAYAAERVLRGQALSEAAFASAIDALLSEAVFRSSPQRASAGYRRKLAGVLLAELLEAASSGMRITEYER